MALIAVLLSGCASTPTGPSDSRHAGGAEDIVVQRLLQQNQPLAAANYLLHLAHTSAGDIQQRQRLEAADYLVRAAQPSEALRLLSQINANGLMPTQQFTHSLTQAEAQFALGRIDYALVLPSPPQNAPRRVNARYHRLLADAFHDAGNFGDSVLQRITLDALLDDERRLGNERQFIDILGQLSPHMLTALADHASTDVRAWIALQHTLDNTPQNDQQLRGQLQQWQSQHPDLKIAADLIEALVADTRLFGRIPNKIAIMLPQSGRYANAANAIRAGILQAYYTDGSATKPQLTFTDSTDLTTLPQVLADIRAGDIEMILGPLQKQAVQILYQNAELSIPVLALNRLEDADTNDFLQPKSFFQLGLSPEDEAIQAADRAWLDGQRRMLLLVPQGAWGKRLRVAFARRWEMLGGIQLEVQEYPPTSNDFGPQIKRLLNIDQSTQRRRTLVRTLGEKLSFEPRRRQDVDAVFIAAHPRQARLIRPQFKFHHASSLPLYATSHVYAGIRDADKDRDLNDLMFCDMPRLLRTDGNQTPPESRGFNPRLIALGKDAYQLIPRLARLQHDPERTVEGATGRLSLDRHDRFQRQMIWARFERGVPVIKGYSPTIEINAESEATARVDF
jgi:outer membrane PBP1 activator LpoA protein